MFSFIEDCWILISALLLLWYIVLVGAYKENLPGEWRNILIAFLGNCGYLIYQKLASDNYLASKISVNFLFFYIKIRWSILYFKWILHMTLYIGHLENAGWVMQMFKCLHILYSIKKKSHYCNKRLEESLSMEKLSDSWCWIQGFQNFNFHLKLVISNKFCELFFLKWHTLIC